MDVSNKYEIFVGTSRGIVAKTNCIKDSKFKYTTTDEPSEITSMEWGCKENDIVIGYKDGSTRLYNAEENKFQKTLRAKEEDRSPIVGIGCTEDTVITGSHRGVINYWQEKLISSFNLQLNEESTLNNVALNKNRNAIGTGGEKNDFNLWDVETQTCLFKAKSLGHDSLNLPIPTSVRGICFFATEDKLSACATKEGHVLLYDDRAQRRPVVKFLEPKASYTVLTSAYRDKQCLTGTTRGYMQLLDLKVPGKCLKTYKSFTGSVTGIQCDAVEPIVISTSLDRFLRVHNLETKELVYKEYMKQNLTKLLVKPFVKEEIVNNSVEKEVDDVEYEQLFEEMETIIEPIGKKRINKQKADYNGEATGKKKKVRKS